MHPVFNLYVHVGTLVTTPSTKANCHPQAQMCARVMVSLPRLDTDLNRDWILPVTCMHLMCIKCVAGKTWIQVESVFNLQSLTIFFGTSLHFLNRQEKFLKNTPPPLILARKTYFLQNNIVQLSMCVGPHHVHVYPTMDVNFSILFLTRECKNKKLVDNIFSSNFVLLSMCWTIKLL